jgi:hypothetical protein
MTHNHELLLELWSRLKFYIPQKERLEVADTFLEVFDDFGMVDESILNEELDRELRAAARSLLAEPDEEVEDDDDSRW